MARWYNFWVSEPSIDAQQVPAAAAAAVDAMRRALEALQAGAAPSPELVQAVERAHSDLGVLLAFLRRAAR